MHVVFADKDLQKQCSNDRLLKKEQGSTRAKLIRRRLDDLRAEDNLQEFKKLHPKRTHEEKGNLKGIISVDLDGPFRLFLEPFDDPPSLLPDGGLDWQNIRTVIILRIENPHGT